ncbi:uncharacterized protein TRUGW13939_03110 [Talaromyces rugulosus]|uniref:Major facilitator superfamily (MFS) profile domain-containing protein n=1 Tax=Talaromyces rugulosus TaxID=121627 RepID=A0A7H8QRD0_TALRU|nr:uncharacterized protein TRUGW13939_03110 [Talaromyces rugulosus]QKX56011.1 hypothetical protein TRUGW13939_03110 [Talaromyces rugulosus]
MPKHKKHAKKISTLYQSLANIDYIDGRTIACLVIGIALSLSFMLVEWWKGDYATVPPKVIKDRVVILSSVFTATLDGAYFVVTYQVPIWFQVIEDLSASNSGYHIILLLACCVMGAMAGTTLTGKLRYYHPFMILGAVLLTVGSGVLTRLHPGYDLPTWVTSEILCGAGTGLATALPLLAVQDVLPPSEVSMGYAVVLSVGYLGSSIALAISQAIFVSQLKLDLDQKLPQIDPDIIVHAGATDLRSVIPPDLYQETVEIYNIALNKGWYVSVALAGISVLLALCFPWKKMDMKDKKRDDVEPSE